MVPEHGPAGKPRTEPTQRPAPPITTTWPMRPEQRGTRSNRPRSAYRSTAAARTASSRPGNRSSISTRRTLFSRVVPLVSCQIKPESLRIFQWWLSVLRGIASKKALHGNGPGESSAVRTISSRTGSLSAARTSTSSTSRMSGCESGRGTGNHTSNPGGSLPPERLFAYSRTIQ